MARFIEKVATALVITLVQATSAQKSTCVRAHGHDARLPDSRLRGKIDGEVFAGDIRVPPAGSRTTKAILLKKERNVRRPRDDGTWTTATGHR